VTELRALTLRQPWAWAIAHAGKDVENRTWGTSWRGLVGIHAGLALDEHGSHDQRVLAARTALGLDIARHWPAQEPRGAFVAVGQLVGVHLAYGGCCDSPWGQRWAHDTARQVRHLELAEVHALPHPIEATGRQGLWDPGAHLARKLHVSWDTARQLAS